MTRNIGDVIKELESVKFSALILLSKRDADGNLLILMLPSKRAGEENPVFKLPGGMQEYDRSARSAVARECWEETGIVVNPKRLWPVWTVHKKDYSGRVPNVQQHVFYCDDFDESKFRTSAINDGRDTLYVPKWVSVPYALENLFPSHQDILKNMMPKLAKHQPLFEQFVPCKGIFHWPFHKGHLKEFPFKFPPGYSARVAQQHH